jgi:sigma-E factor negative regulatory protein RseC
MSEKGAISHPGIVESIEGQKVNVKILAQSACSSCHAKGMCSVAEMEEKIIEVNTGAVSNLKPGDTVQITMKKSLGPRAVFLGYLLPFLILLTTLITVLAITGNEGLAAIIAILVLVPYYVVLYYLKDRISKTFRFSLE